MSCTPATDTPQPRRGGAVAWRARLAAAMLPGLLLGGCHYASSPFVGFPGFISDTHTFTRDPTLPPGSEETMMQSEGRPQPPGPLLPETGNIWPGPAPLDPTLADVGKALANPGQEQQLVPPQQQEVPTNPNAPPPKPAPHGSSTPPGLIQTNPAAPPAAPPRGQGSSPSVSTVPGPATPPVINTPNGPLINNGPIGVPGGASTATNPSGGQNIVVPNGNGTSTVIAPDGSTQIIPTPK